MQWERIHHVCLAGKENSKHAEPIRNMAGHRNTPVGILSQSIQTVMPNPSHLPVQPLICRPSIPDQGYRHQYSAIRCCRKSHFG